MKKTKAVKWDYYNILICFLFLLPLSGTGLPAYFVAILFLVYRLGKIELKLQDVFFLIALILWFILKCQQTEIYASLVLLRYYFGFYIFYLFFSIIDKDINLDRLLIVICIAVLIEAVLINTIIKPEWLLNYPKHGDFEDSLSNVYETQILGFYQKPYSIGGNSTITSSIIMVLLFYCYSFYRRILFKSLQSTLILAIITIVMLGSGTGYILLLLFLIFKIGPFRNSSNAIISSLVIFIIYYLIFILDIGSTEGFDKISSFYIQNLYDFKIMQFNDDISDLLLNINQLYIGKKFENASQLIIWSDFAWDNLFYCTGFIGFGITILILIFKTNKYNWIPVLILMIGAFHYAAMYALQGQMLLGYFLSPNFKNKVKDQLMNPQSEPNLLPN